MLEISSLLAENVRTLRLVDGKFAIAIRIIHDGKPAFTQPLMMDATPTLVDKDIEGEFDEEGNPRVIRVVEKYRVTLLPLYMIPGTTEKLPDNMIKEDHVMCEAWPTKEMIDHYFKTMAAYKNTQTRIEQ